MTVEEALTFMAEWTPSDDQADEALNVLADEVKRLREVVAMDRAS